MEVSGQRQQQQPRRHARGDVAALDDVGSHGVGVEAGVERDPRQQVQRGVEEGEQAQQAAELDEPAQARREPAQGRDGQRDEQQAQRGEAGGEGDGVRRVGAQVVGDGAPQTARPAAQRQASQVRVLSRMSVERFIVVQRS